MNENNAPDPFMTDLEKEARETEDRKSKIRAAVILDIYNLLFFLSKKGDCYV